MADRRPFNALCGNAACNHVWIVCYLPMPMHLAAELMAAARCPMCASRNALGHKTSVRIAADPVGAPAEELAHG